MNVYAFAMRVYDDDAAFRFAIRLGLIRGPPTHCPACHHLMWFEKGKKVRGVNGVWRCKNRDCTRETLSLFAGSVFEKSQLTVSQFLKVLFGIAEEKKVLEVAHDADVAAKTVVVIHQLIRKMMADFNRINRRLVGGPQLTVEIDECHVHTRKYNVGRVIASQQWWVVGGICRQTRETFVVITPTRDKPTLRWILFHNVAANSVIYTAGWGGYFNIEEMGLNCIHRTVDHSHNFVNLNYRDVHTNTIERAWRTLREALPEQITVEHVQSYLDKFIFFHHHPCQYAGERFQVMVELCKFFFPTN